MYRKMRGLSRCLVVSALFLMPLLGVRAEERLRVVATTTQAADLVRAIGGERVALTALMSGGVDPHQYKPTASDIAAMNAAQAVIYSGLNLEGQFEKVFEALGQRMVRTYALSEPVLQAGFLLEEAHGVLDPHFWFDPRNWMLAAEGLAELLAELDAPNAAFYRANAAAYSAQLEALYDWARSALTDSAIPEAKRVLITSHDAFRYFGDAFGWRVRGIQGISTVAEASVSDIQAVAELLAAEGIEVIFIESSVPRATVEAVIAAARARGVEVRLGVRALYSDAMGDPDKFGGTYLEMIVHNVITILQSFGYKVPPLPARLALSLPEDFQAR
ncbi:MAG: manganese transporter [Candidatus Thermofonsia Clade 1 bacterium]|uniref:Manganese transporter n=1 Tax=Candidatus Thermofonsia Clade 1 bacterium TaxID=2364210 RepID=A0A2M8PEJ9_9CHLR|nr:MAG: manganese transporter [Candidatus Thermofonsia Clade 1 bacterium]